MTAPTLRAPIVAEPSPRPILERALASLPPEPLDPETPRYFFINAHPRSGTNWLSALLNLHPRIRCTGEYTFHDLFNALQATVTQPGRAAAREPARTVALRNFQRLIRECMASTSTHHTREPAHATPAPAVRWFGDHTPRRLRIFLPDAQYIALFRDGRDVVVSWTYNALARKEHWVVPAPIRPLFDAQLDRFHQAPGGGGGGSGTHLAAQAMLACEPWVRHVARQWASHIRDDLDAVARLRSGDLPGSVFPLRYEDLHADTLAQRDRLYRFLALNPDEAAPLDQGSRTTPGFATEDPTSHFRRGQVGDWKTKLPAEAVGWIQEEAGTELATLNY